MKLKFLLVVAAFLVVSSVHAASVIVKVGDSSCQSTDRTITSSKDRSIKEGTVITFKCSKWWTAPVKIYLNGTVVASWPGKDYRSTYIWTAKKNAKIRWKGYSKSNPNIYLSDEETDPVLSFSNDEIDSEACKELKLKAQNEIDALRYDETKSLEENKAVVDAILKKLNDDLAAQRQKEAAQKMAENVTSFESYQNSLVNEVAELASADDSETSRNAIADAKSYIRAQSYNASKSLNDNKANLDNIVNKLKSDLNSQRAKESAEKLEANKAIFNSYKSNKVPEADKLLDSKDSKECKALVTTAKTSIQQLTYDEAKTLAENKQAADDIVWHLSANLKEQRQNEARAIQIAADKAVFNSLKAAMIQSIDEIRAKESDCDNCDTVINEAKAAVSNHNYDDSKSLEENKKALDRVIVPLSSQLAEIQIKNAAKKLAADSSAFESYKNETIKRLQTK